MATSYALLLFRNLTFFAFLASIIIESSIVGADSRLVEELCNQTQDYKFCKDALDSDLRTPGADAVTLAYVAFGLAYSNASSTQDHITSLLSNSTGPVHQHLEQCQGDYFTAIAAIQDALTDLDSEKYGSLTYFSSTIGHQAEDCESAFMGTKSPLTDSNNDLNRLSVICVAIAEWLAV
ncbi:cell wall / vacuolar inhibitor of fructosidase 2-like [Rhodamnia argentea]|uniref:Cell wall / vacuolar inhibitor of fructosidase 2-like n=1 Tax=Rhodamnia argentea TaxID=178133 RepID=A0A8B8N3J0_9MYRT|nr:cell wall / vacuolar inhibitor of fructosidase 2-like [Rhodamnia argentea]